MWFIIKSCPTDEVPCKSLAGNERMEPHSSSQKKGVCSNLPWKQPLSCVCYWAAHLAHYQLLFFICGSWAWAKYSSGAPRECVCESVCVVLWTWQDRQLRRKLLENRGCRGEKRMWKQSRRRKTKSQTERKNNIQVSLNLNFPFFLFWGVFLSSTDNRTWPNLQETFSSLQTSALQSPRSFA